ncbi:UvrD-helicase domain-containing protein [Lunatibacter salilacus]|uniref:UvrD-helicase domain-containing protein n=1 Tax=Lunatibacter salilacus TaxID=2483804 RepID=UPI00131DA80A|nr:UvrD-helicase domain-containing protein [Lunatibacter salilacus]
MKYFIDKSITHQIQALMRRGGQFQKAAEKIKQLVFDINSGDPSPFRSVSMTNHGESRIKNCIKYDLQGYARLITIQSNGECILKFLGTHEECDKWLNNNRNLNLGIEKGSKEIKDVYKSNNIHSPEERVGLDSDYSDGKLIKKIGVHYLDKLFDQISIKQSTIRRLAELESISDEDEILSLCEQIVEKTEQEVIFDVFMELRHGSVDHAKNRILEFIDEIQLLEKVKEEEKVIINSNDQYLRLDDLEEEDLKILMDNKNWHDWMLFMHPAQRQVVDQDFSGSARLLGVSGSGKTCVIVRRAVRLANKYPEERILILTLNRSLAKLIRNLVDILIETKSHSEKIKSQIKVTSYWELCREYILRMDKDPMRARLYNDYVDKQQDSIDEIWSEFYRCQNYNYDAEVLFPVHQSLLSRGVFPQNYIRQEFDWIRSALSNQERNKYLSIERDGRSINLPENYREAILNGLKSWEKHMPEVGVTDYLGLSQKVLNFKDQIKEDFKCILVDEFQDFGTIEMEVIRRLAPKGENDLFLCGDIAQVVHTKHHRIRLAGINIIPQNYLKIEKNYRNSREILAAAYEVFKNNTSNEMYQNDGFEVLKPEFANFSSPKPFLRKASSLSRAFMFSWLYLNDILDSKNLEKACIAVCGYSYYDIDLIGKKLKIPVLDGKIDLSGGNIFLSDLENTKGFEFDRMIILNCNDHVIPNNELPKEEWFREISKFYVAMTRAKKELIMSYNDTPSSLFDSCKDYFTEDRWIDHIDTNRIHDEFTMPSTSENNLNNGYINLLGKDFLYSKIPIGITTELQNKILDTVTGKDVSDGSKPLEWRTIGNLTSYIKSKGRDYPHLSRLFGPERIKELEELL